MGKYIPHYHKALAFAQICALLFFILPLHAELSLAPPFKDNAILQRDKPVPVWGTADPCGQITVRFNGQSKSTIVDADGKWKVTLEPLSASKLNQTLTVQNDTEKLEVRNVLVGEVWLASGQSNMAWLLGSSDHPPYPDLLKGRPLVRQFKSEQKVSDRPQTTNGGQWYAAAPDTIGSFSAVGGFFALELYRQLDVPVGFINSSRGSTRIQAWLDPKTANASNGPAFASIQKKWETVLNKYPRLMAKYHTAMNEWNARKAEAEAQNKSFKEMKPTPPWGPGHLNTPSGMFNGTIAPHIPYAIRGVIWYQGEADATRASTYDTLFKALIQGWRREFNQGTLPFYWAQLTSYKGKGSDNYEWAQLREAQSKALELPQTGQAITIDVGDAESIHPTQKQPVGQRLAYLALAKVYGLSVLDTGPEYDHITSEDCCIRVHFKSTNSPLKLSERNPQSGFDIAGADKIFHPADSARIDGDTIVLQSKVVPYPKAVRYAWRNVPTVSLFNAADLPAAPFRSDNW